MKALFAGMEKWETVESPEIVRRVREEQVRQLYSQTWGGLLGTLLIIASVLAILWQVIPHGKLLSWSGILVALTVLRGCLTAAYLRRDPQARPVSFWARLHVVSASGAAFLWGVPAFYLWPADSPIHQMVWPICIVSVTAAAVAMYCYWPPSFFSFLIFSTAPISIRLLYGGTLVYVVLGCLGLVFIGLLARTGQLMHSAIIQGLVVSTRNQVLSRVLTEEKLKVENLNRQLIDEITVRKHSQRELEERNQELERLNGILTATKTSLESTNRELAEALANVKQLSGMLPICASCKKIRNDKGYWQQLEAYFHDRSEVEFSHGICPECSEKLYPGVRKRRLGKADSRD